jgi:hypothetical protein
MESKENNDFILYAYCITNENEYTLILNANGSDISKIMKGINISYAMYVNQSGSLYRDRYKSNLIKDRDTLLNLIITIHEREHNTDSIYNSHCFYSRDTLSDSKLIDKRDIELFLMDETCFRQSRDCKNCINTQVEAALELKNVASSKGLSVEDLLKPNSVRNTLIKEFRKKSTLSLKDLGEVFGGLSESSICKILKCKELPEERNEGKVNES